MKGFHEIVISGIDLIEAQQGHKRCFDHWVSSVSDWLRQSGCDQVMVFDWFSLNLVDADQELPVLGNDDELLAYLDKISQRWKWLAMLANSGKMPSGTKNRSTLKQTLKSLGQKNGDMLLMGINGLRVKDYLQAQTNFILWLRTIADKLNVLCPEKGFDAEWLSLPTMTFYINKSVIGGGRQRRYLIDVVSSRILWLGKLIGVDTKKIISALGMLKGKPMEAGGVMDLMLEDLVVSKQTKAPVPETPLHRELSEKEWLTLEELSIYTGYAKKTIYNWTYEGKLPSSKPQGKLLFKRTEVDKWLLKNSGYLRNGYKK